MLNKEVIRKMFSHKMLFMLVHGISSGTPLLLIGGTLQLWMKDLKFDLATIGMIALVKLPYSIKPLWSPLLDRFRLPFLGRRKGWILFFQIMLALSIAGLGQIQLR